MAFDEDASLRRNRNHSWWKQRTNMERRGVIILIIALLIIIGLIIAVALVGRKKTKSETEHVCVTQGCVKSAADVLSRLDQSINPCEDFYQFSCGGFIKKTELPEDKSFINSMSLLDDGVKKQLKDMFEEPIKEKDIKTFTLAKKLYKICMNTTAIEKENLTGMKQFFKNAGGWPILDGPGWNGDFHWMTFMQKLRKLQVAVDSFVDISIAIHPVNSEKRIITLNQPPLNVAKENLIGGFNDDLVVSYYKYLVDLAVFFGAPVTFAEREVTDVVNFQIDLAKITLSDAERRELATPNNIMTIDEVQKKFPGINWLELINNMIDRQDRFITNTSETVNVLSVKYLSSVVNLLNTASKRVQANYALFQILYSKINFLPDYVRNREQEFIASYQGTTKREARWSECVDYTTESLSIAVGALYARKYFHEDARQNAKEMISDIRSALVGIIKKVDWMDETTRKIAIEKALAIKNHIGYPDEFLDDKKLDEYYADLNLTSNSYLQASNEIMGYRIDQGIEDLKKPINKTDWRTRSSIVTINAQYLLQENSVELLAGILQGNFFNKDRPHYMNYGAIGYVIGHEMTHGFDDQGKQYNKEGNLANWWANKTDQAFSERAKCMIDQYSEIIVPEAGQNVNGKLTEGENIADNGGIKEAYLAYQAWVGRNGPEPILPGLNFTEKQLFWISAAHCWCIKERHASLMDTIASDEHAPSRYRVIVPFSNNNDFAKDFNCPLGSKMNPKHKCTLW